MVSRFDESIRDMTGGLGVGGGTRQARRLTGVAQELAPILLLGFCRASGAIAADFRKRPIVGQIELSAA